jgi:hypothetical protein
LFQMGPPLLGSLVELSLVVKPRDEQVTSE